MDLLEHEVRKMVSGQDWRSYLDFQSRLHDYSSRNSLLIAAQHAHAFVEGRVDSPIPGSLAGYRTWLAMGRQVERGQHGYAILAPVRSVRRQGVDAIGQVRPLGGDEQIAEGEEETLRTVIRGFRVEYVFEVSMTSGAPLPQPPRPRLLKGEAPSGLGPMIADLIESSGFEVSTVPDAESIGGANGRTDWRDRTVVIRCDMDDAAMVKTLLHEAAHVLLHGEPPGQLLPRAVKEVEAESVAYVVADAHGMSTGSYSFPYVAHWARGADAVRAVQDCQDRIGAAARDLIDCSPAAHCSGGRPPGADVALAMAGQSESRLRPAPGLGRARPRGMGI